MNMFTDKFNLTGQEKLKAFFVADGCAIEEQAHAIFRAANKSKGYNAVFYKTGKLVIQGKSVDEVVKKFSEKFAATVATQTKLLKTDFAKKEIAIPLRHIGTDESGKGDFFGPLVVAGVLVDEKTEKILKALGVKDSKKLDDLTMAKMAITIQKNCPHSIVTINPAKYNELYAKFKNLNKLLAWAHSRAIENILEGNDCNFVLSDKFGDESLIKNALFKKGKTVKLEQRVRAESDIAVAAASILARSEFVKKMKALSSFNSIMLPKGASDRVIQAGIDFSKKYSSDKLDTVAKMHFKTLQDIKKKLGE